MSLGKVVFEKRVYMENKVFPDPRSYKLFFKIYDIPFLKYCIRNTERVLQIEVF